MPKNFTRWRRLNRDFFSHYCSITDNCSINKNIWKIINSQSLFLWSSSFLNKKRHIITQINLLVNCWVLFCLFIAVWIAWSWKLLYMGHSKLCMTKLSYLLGLLQFWLLGKIKLCQLGRCQGAFIWMRQVFVKTSELRVWFTLGVCPLGRIEEKNGISLPGGILLGMGMPFPWILILWSGAHCFC